MTDDLLFSGHWVRTMRSKLCQKFKITFYYVHVQIKDVLWCWLPDPHTALAFPTNFLLNFIAFKSVYWRILCEFQKPQLLPNCEKV